MPKNVSALPAIQFLTLVNTLPTPDKSHVVWLDKSGIIWDATLVRMSCDVPSEVLRMQIIHGNSEGTAARWVYHRGYDGPGDMSDIDNSDDELSDCTNTSSNQIAGEHHSRHAAKKRFREDFQRLTGLSWHNRNDVPHIDHWIFLDMAYPETLIMGDYVVNLPQQVEDIMKMIFQSKYLKDYVYLLHKKGCEVKLKTTEQQRNLRIGLACLEKHMKMRDSEIPCRAEYKLERISHEMIKGSAEFPNRKIEAVMVELDSLNLLLKLHDATKILTRSPTPSLGLSRVAYALNVAKMNPGMSFYGHDILVKVWP